MGHVNSINGLGDRANLIKFNQNGVGNILGYTFF